MAKGGMVIDVLTSPSEEDFPEESSEEAPSPRQDPEALISEIEATLSKLRAWAAGTA